MSKHMEWCDNCGYNDETCSACSTCFSSCSNFVEKSEVTKPSVKRQTPKERPAAVPEPPPVGKGSFVLSEVLKDLCARADLGMKKYGTMLRTNNGRDALLDAYQERLDELMYFKQALMEREESLEEKIVKWANDRRLYEYATHESQLSKLHEELGEWQDEVLSGDKAAEMLELGDMYVVLVNIARIRGFSLEHCGWAAYEKIKDRTGRMENGSFVKD